MTVEDRSLLRLAWDTLNPVGISVVARKGQFIVSFVDQMAGLISWAVSCPFKAYKLGLDMRDHRSAYVDAKRDYDAHPETVFFTANIQHIKPGIA